LTWEEAKVELQIASEERAGFVMRKTAEIMRAQEDAAFAQAVAASSGDR